MASFKEVFGADKDQQANGKWVSYGGIKIKIAFANEENPEYLKVLDKCTRHLQEELRASSNVVSSMDNLPEMKLALMRVYSKCVIRDWANVTDDAGNEVPFSEKACLEALKENPAMFRWARDYADQIANFQPEVTASAEKNSETA